MHKRGAAHIEMVLAFILFITIVVFAIYYLSINKNVQDNAGELTKIQDRIYQNLTSEVAKYSLKINSTNRNQIIPVKLNIPTGYYARIYNLSGTETKGNYDGTYLYVNSNKGLDYQIIVGKEITSSYEPTLTGTYSSSKYEIGPSNKIEIISERNARALNLSYNSNYVDVKKAFLISGDYGIEASVNNESIISLYRAAPQKVGVFRSENSKEILMEDGEIKFGKIVVWIW